MATPVSERRLCRSDSQYVSSPEFFSSRMESFRSATAQSGLRRLVYNCTSRCRQTGTRVAASRKPFVSLVVSHADAPNDAKLIQRTTCFSGSHETSCSGDDSRFWQILE